MIFAAIDAVAIGAVTVAVLYVLFQLGVFLFVGLGLASFDGDYAPESRKIVVFLLACLLLLVILVSYKSCTTPPHYR